MSTDTLHAEKQILASMARLRTNPDFDRFLNGYIGGLLRECVETCIHAEHSARAQGAAQVLQRISKDVSEAEQAYLKLSGQAEIPL